MQQRMNVDLRSLRDSKKPPSVVDSPDPTSKFNSTHNNYNSSHNSSKFAEIDSPDPTSKFCTTAKVTKHSTAMDSPDPLSKFNTTSTNSTNRDVSLFFKYRQRDSCVW
jgi:hypothetical protein